jgi:hypothetical protein
MLDELRKKIEDLKQQMTSEGSKILHEEAKKIFEKYPELESFSWCQYTCYFNDGDELYFSVYADDYTISINGKNYGTWYNKDGAWQNQAQKEISQLIYGVEDILKDLYGDHTEITMYRDGEVSQSEYTNHD